MLNHSILMFTVCEEYTPKAFRFHPGIWLNKKWSCCKSNSRNALGCQVAAHWPEANNNPSKCIMFHSLNTTLPYRVSIKEC
jgi:hypothetical protein